MQSQPLVSLEVFQSQKVYAVERFVELALVALENAVVRVNCINFELSLIVVLFFVVATFHFKAILGQL